MGYENDRELGTTRPRTFAMFNDLTGGPIFTDGETPVVVGLNSHKLLTGPNGPLEQPPRMFSPFFGAALPRLIRWLIDNGGFPELDDTGEAEETGGGATASLKATLQRKVSELNTLIGQLPG